MKLNDIKVSNRAKKTKKRLGRGNSSGHGTYSGKGVKGQKSRAGAKIKLGFEGGKTSLVKQIPKKRGFKSLATPIEVVNIEKLDNRFKDGDKIDKKALFEAKLISNSTSRVKILGEGELKKKFSIIVDSCSASARKKIEAGGGSIKTLIEQDTTKKHQPKKKNDSQTK